MFHKVKSVSPLPCYALDVCFENGDRRRYEVQPLFERWPVFQNLRDVPGLFGQVQVDAGGYGISWNDDIDLACDELWENGEPLPSLPKAQ